jgi:hypothetical protein
VPVSGSTRVLGCLKTPPAFLEAVPSAWTVTRGVPVGRGLYGCWVPSVHPPAAFLLQGGLRAGKAKCKVLKENYPDLSGAKHYPAYLGPTLGNGPSI